MKKISLITGLLFMVSMANAQINRDRMQLNIPTNAQVTMHKIIPDWSGYMTDPGQPTLKVRERHYQLGNTQVRLRSYQHQARRRQFYDQHLQRKSHLEWLAICFVKP